MMKKMNLFVSAVAAACFMSAGGTSAIVNANEMETEKEKPEEAGYVIEEGMAQPILQYSDFRNPEYSNQNSDILRFCVYVETDHDTDNDGRTDLVKVFAQVPTAAVQGEYKAAAIYDPTPYNVGTVDNFDFKLEDYSEQFFDYDILYKDCEKRESAEEIATYDLAMNQYPGEWNYVVPATGSAGFIYGNLNFAGNKYSKMQYQIA